MGTGGAEVNNSGMCLSSWAGIQLGDTQVNTGIKQFQIMISEEKKRESEAIGQVRVVVGSMGATPAGGSEEASGVGHLS